MGYKSVAEAIKRFEKRDRDESIKKRTILENYRRFRTTSRFEYELKKIIKKQLVTYRYSRYSCHIIKKEIREMSRKKELEIYAGFFSELIRYVEKVREKSQKKIDILERQENLIDGEISESKLTMLSNLYKQEVEEVFDANEMKERFEEFGRRFRSDLIKAREAIIRSKILKPEQMQKLDSTIRTIISPVTVFMNRLLLGHTQIIMGSNALTIYSVLTMISHPLGPIKDALMSINPVVGGLVYIIKIVIDFGFRVPIAINKFGGPV